MLISVLIFILCIIIGVPIAFSLGAASLTYLYVHQNIPLSILAQRLFTGLDVFPFMAIPFFILAGELMNSVGITKKLVNFSDVLVGRLRGGLGHVNIVASMFFAGITGSAVADTSAIGSMLIPAMEEQGFDTDFSAAVTASSSVIGPIIPPSIPMVIYAIISSQSVAALFLAGFFPGVLLGFGLMFINYIISRKRKYPRREKQAGLKEILNALANAIVPLLMPCIILGGILGGVFTATEASAVAVIYALLIDILLYRTLNFKEIKRVFISTAKTTGVVFLVIACASTYNWMLTCAQVPQRMTMFLAENFQNPVLFLFFINVMLLFIGTFMEGTAAMIITVPVLLPIAHCFGVDPVMLGAIVVLNLMIGLITPPVGLCLYVASGICKLSIERITKAILPFLAVEILVLMLVTYIKPITMFLPRLFGYL
ncbi:MAG: TRAP transporter large permease [Spirochaetota bacterium]|nr:MAG: TRAP transporter large permease [Spirochaetota bacterium]